jgi:hypothetical protein
MLTARVSRVNRRALVEGAGSPQWQRICSFIHWHQFRRNFKIREINYEVPTPGLHMHSRGGPRLLLK